MTISLIAAVAAGNVLGHEGKMPWHLPADLKHFRKLTLHHPVIMGRKTFESIGKPLKGRLNIIITRNKDFKAEGAVVVHSLQDALTVAQENKSNEEIFIIGGGEIFRQAMPFADKIYLTEIDASVAGDVFFPEIHPKAWRLIEVECFQADEHNPFDYCFKTFVRNR